MYALLLLFLFESQETHKYMYSKKEKSSNPIVIFFSLRSQITGCPDDRREEEEESAILPTGYEN
jgi:hypothetical protein